MGWSSLIGTEGTFQLHFNQLSLTRVLRTTHLLLDREHHIIGVLVGRPRNSKDWDSVHDKALAALEAAASKMTFTDKEKTHRRGFFPAIPHGISFGGGQEVLLFSEPHRAPADSANLGTSPPQSRLKSKR